MSLETFSWSFLSLMRFPGVLAVCALFNSSRISCNIIASQSRVRESCCFGYDCIGRKRAPKENMFSQWRMIAIKGSFESFWRKRINSSVGPSKSGGNKLRLYKLFKCRFQAETYTKLKDRSLIKSMAKLRCSNHNLHIETGRRDNTPPELRYCRLCNSQEVEDEHHFLVECRTYGQQRK